jgi:PAS domain-containing protein
LSALILGNDRAEVLKMIEKPSYEYLKQRVRELKKAESERKHMEEDLPDNGAKFRLLAENMNDILWTADLGMNITYLSPSIEKVLGFTVEERLKQSLQEQMPPESLQLAAERLAEELSSMGFRSRRPCMPTYQYQGV